MFSYDGIKVFSLKTVKNRIQSQTFWFRSYKGIKENMLPVLKIFQATSLSKSSIFKKNNDFQVLTLAQPYSIQYIHESTLSFQQ